MLEGPNYLFAFCLGAALIGAALTGYFFRGNAEEGSGIARDKVIAAGFALFAAFAVIGLYEAKDLLP